MMTSLYQGKIILLYDRGKNNTQKYERSNMKKEEEKEENFMFECIDVSPLTFAMNACCFPLQ